LAGGEGEGDLGFITKILHSSIFTTITGADYKKMMVLQERRNTKSHIHMENRRGME